MGAGGHSLPGERVGEAGTHYDPEGIFLFLLSPGSVKVEHDVILKANFTPDYKDVLDKAIQDVESKIKTTTQEQISTNNTCESKFLGFWGGP